MGVTKSMYQCISFLKYTVELPYDPTIPLLCNTLRTLSQHATEIIAHLCILLHYSQQTGNRANLDVRQQMNGQSKCGTYTQWNLQSAIKQDEGKAYSGKCMELKITVLSERNQSQRDNYHIFFLLYKIYVGLEYMCICLSVCLHVCHTMHVCV